ncbi:MAG: hypothetical protein CMN06_00205 [Roseibacillus sp.]|nr:hypothetical protein [Roseibacillus sp.]
MRTYLTISLLTVMSISMPAEKSPNFSGRLPVDLAELPPLAGLTNPLISEAGSKITQRADWKTRRKKLIDLLLFYQYGRIPGRPDRITASIDLIREHTSGLGTEEWITLTLGTKEKLKMRLVAYIPRTKGLHPVVIEEEGSPGGSRNASMFMEKNYIFIEYARGDLAPDKRGSIGPAQRAYPDFDWAMLAVWAWGGMRVVDYLESRPDVDHDRIAITGHSRGGKAALLAGALDERIALVAPCQSGAGGAGSSRILGPGAESIGMNDKPDWYNERIRLFAGKEEHLPFDQHFLKALVAPRALLCMESSDDLFANPIGTQATSEAAMPVFQLFDREHANGLTYRRGGHSYSSEDWKSLLNFAEFIFYDRDPPEDVSFWQEPFPLEPTRQISGEQKFIPIGQPGNKGDEDRPRVGSHGAVGYPFEIGKNRVTNAEYCLFLNAVAQTEDPHELYNPKMSIERDRLKGSPRAVRYSPSPEAARLPVTYISWFDAARYCNWLHGGQTEIGSYDLTKSSPPLQRMNGAKAFLPSENEWYKAAYFDPRKNNYTYFRDSFGGLRSRLSGRNPSRSPYGMMGMDDPIWDWAETAVGSLFRCVRSNTWFQGNNRQAAGHFYSNSVLELGNLGFRIARPLGKNY